jgi:hypothetical protein
MSFMDRVKIGLDKAKEGISDFAETTKLKHEIGKLEDRKTALFVEIGRQVYTLRAQGRGVADVEAQCKEIDTVDEKIKQTGEEIARIHTEAHA